MDNKYIITPSGSFVTTDELYHWGILGMKWGVRRYQNKDGTLTDAGKKRYTNPDGSLNEAGKKKLGKMASGSEGSGNSGNSSSGSKPKPSPINKKASDMEDIELQQKVNRLRNEDAYNELSKKLGYDGPKTELDMKIADMEKQKRYLELQRDINNLTPKKVSRGKKIVEALWGKVVEPAATEAGKKLLTEYLTEAGAKAFKKSMDKEADSIKKSVKDSTERVKKKEAKKEAKQAAKEASAQARKEAKQAAKEASAQARKEAKQTSKVHDAEPVSNSSKNSSSSNSFSKYNSSVIDMYKNSDGVYTTRPVTDLTTTRNTSAGSYWVSKYRNNPVRGYLPPPRKDDD